MLNYMERIIMTLFASCGCEIKDGEQEFLIATKESSIDFDLDRMVNSVKHWVVCKECYKSYRRENLILETKEDEQRWMYETP